MGSKRNPGACDGDADAHPDEPIFVLRGRDDRMPALVRLWAAAAKGDWALMEEAYFDLGGRQRAPGRADPAELAEALDCAERAEAWRATLAEGPPSVSIEAETGRLVEGVSDSCWPGHARALRGDAKAFS